MNNKRQCEIKGCQEPAKYALYKTYPNGEKKWLHVCEECERKIGQENFDRTFGCYTK